MAARIEATGFQDADSAVAGGERSDVDLCLAARDGDRRAYEILVLRYQRPVYGLAVRLLRNQEEARDAAQEVFVKAWLALEAYDPDRAFAPWLLTVARNYYRDRLRRLSVRKGDVQTDDPTETLSRLPDRASDDAEEALATTQTGDLLEAALGELPEHYREVVILHHVQERPVKEIAEIVGRPQGTVMTWLYRARAHLKQNLTQRGLDA